MKLLALTPWPFIPAISGGPERCYNLLSGLDDVTAFALDWTDQEKWQRRGNINYRVIPADTQAVDQAKKLMANGLHSWDAIPTLTARNLKTIRAEIQAADPDLIILEHPWLIDLIGDIPFIYDAHNFETQHHQQMFGRTTLDRDIIANIEARAIRQAEHITYCSQTDWEAMSKVFPHNTPGTLIRNGAYQGKLSTGKSHNLLFIGSMYTPNIQAARNLIDLAPHLPEYTIQIVGHCADAITTNAPNVQLYGTVTNQQRDQLFEQAHQFVNLIDHGSGTHLKIARALSHGLPVITTKVGARGYDNLIVTTQQEAVNAIRQVTNDWASHSTQAQQTFTTHNWETITADFKQVINGLQ
jgi:uncharacterized protein YoaH (UPF0181 family)